MAERSGPQGTSEQDPPWPTMHPEDDYDGTRVVEEDDPTEAGIPIEEDRDEDDAGGRPGPADEV